MKRVTEIWLCVFGVVCAGIGLSHLTFGSATIVGGGAVNATIDSDMRFYALLFTAYGATFVWCAANIAERGRVANALGAVFFAGGIARLVAWAGTGQPNWTYVPTIPVELVIPLVNHALIRQTSRFGRDDAAPAHANT